MTVRLTIPHATATRIGDVVEEVKTWAVVVVLAVLVMAVASAVGSFLLLSLLDLGASK
jgi:hypothetical protein